MSLSVKARQALEKRIARAFIKQALAAGFAISVFDGMEEPIIKSRDETAIIKAMFSVDTEHLFLYRDEDGGKRFGWVFFVYGNDGWDVVSDYTTNLEPYMTEANKIADQYN